MRLWRYVLLTARQAAVRIWKNLRRRLGDHGALRWCRLRTLDTQFAYCEFSCSNTSKPEDVLCSRRATLYVSVEPQAEVFHSDPGAFISSPEQLAPLSHFHVLALDS